jgi:hypothetical protein
VTGAPLDCFAPLAKTIEVAAASRPGGVGERHRCRTAAAEKSLSGGAGKSKVPFIDTGRQLIEDRHTEADGL